MLSKGGTWFNSGLFCGEWLRKGHSWVGAVEGGDPLGLL